MDIQKLTQEELSELVGGVETGTVEPPNVLNKNNTAGCVCTYNNAPQAIYNINSVDGCLCKCVFRSSAMLG
ncbi:MAG: hypothetical protein LBV41_03895 [Cytophagaceae bacterium]|jgi:hypothetical protein|nr:hypothetical protein [Cytophagaceae bacterium]